MLPHLSFLMLSENDLCGDIPNLHLPHLYTENNDRLHKPCSTPPSPSPGAAVTVPNADAVQPEKGKQPYFPLPAPDVTHVHAGVENEYGGLPLSACASGIGVSGTERY